MAARGFLGAGDLYIAQEIAGVFQPFQGPFEATKFEIKPNVTIKELSSRGRNTYGQVIESVALAEPAEFTVELAEVNKAALALALLGTQADLAQTSGSITAEVTAAAVLDSWLTLSKANFTTAALTVTNVAASTTYVEGTDYIVNRQMGWIKPLSTGAITAAQVLHVTGSYLATTGTRISGGTQATLRAKFRLDGINQADGLPCIVEVHEGVIAANTAFDFLANDFATVTLPGKMKTPTGYTEPFTVDLRTA